MYIIRQYADISLMDTPKEKFKQVFKNADRVTAKKKMIDLASEECNNSWALIQLDGEDTITLQKIQNLF